MHVELAAVQCRVGSAIASVSEIFVCWPLIAVVPGTIASGVALAAVFSDKQ